MGKRRHVNTISSGRLLNNSIPDHDQSLDKPIYTNKGGDEFILEKKRDETGGDVIVLKNGTEIIDIPLSTIREKLLCLYEVRNVRISQLSVEHRDKFMNLTTIMQGLRKTSSYNELISLIDEIFSKGTNVILPGTINAYLNGCKVHTNFTPFACSPICSGSIQPIDMGDGWSVCDKYTILFDEKDSRLTVMNNPPNKEEAYIFVPTTDKFTGFTDNERDALLSKGIKKVKIVSYDQSGKNTSNVTEEFVSLENIHIKSVKKEIVNQKNSSWNGWYIFLWVALAIIIILVILLLIYFIIAASSKKKKDTSDKLFESMTSDNYEPYISSSRAPRSRIASSMSNV